MPLFVRVAHDRADAGVGIVEPVDFSAFAALEAGLLGLDPRSPGEILRSLRAR